MRMGEEMRVFLMGHQRSLSHIHILCTFCASKINNRGSKLLQPHFFGVLFGPGTQENLENCRTRKLGDFKMKICRASEIDKFSSCQVKFKLISVDGRREMILGEADFLIVIDEANVDCW